MRTRFIGCPTLILAAGLHAATLVVDQGGGGDFTAIQPAIDAVAEGDTVLVRPGEYVITAPITFVGKAITVRGEAGAEQTTIRMSETPADPERTHVVVFENGETAEALLQGFTLTGGGSPGGRGVFCDNGSSPRILDCTITRNAGGGVSCQNNSSPALTSLRITDNSGTSGGGIRCLFGCSPVISGCTIARNSSVSAGGGGSFFSECFPTITDSTICDNSVLGWVNTNAACDGGGIRLVGGHLTIDGCVISGNSAADRGGGMALAGSATISDCVISGNRATGTYYNLNRPDSGTAGGISCEGGDGTHVEITRCTIAGNVATFAGGGVHAAGTVSLRIVGSIIWDNAGGSIQLEEGVAASLEFNCVEGAEPFPGEGNINDDPLFRAWGDDAEAVVHAQTDFEAALRGYGLALAAASPCIGAGKDGEDMGAGTERCAQPGHPTKSIILGAGTFAIDGLDLTHRVSVTGAGPEASIIEGTVYGLRTNRSLSGVTITKGRAGGIVVSGGEAPDIAGCAIVRNASVAWYCMRNAGGITCGEGSSPTIRDCLISLNTSQSLFFSSGGNAGGVLCRPGSSVAVSRCTVSRNRREGILCAEAAADIRDCRITGNGSPSAGCGLRFLSSSARIANCVMAGNYRDSVLCTDSPVEITHCTILENNSIRLLYNSGPIYPLVRNCIIGGHINYDTSVLPDDSITFSCTVLSLFPGEGNISRDPALVSGGVYDYARYEPIEINGTTYDFPDFIVTPGDFHLQSGSSCIDAGTSTAALAADIEGAPRPQGAGYDMGAYEYPAVVVVSFVRGEVNGDGRVDIADAVAVLGHLFGGRAAPSCLKSADANDNGEVNVADAVYILGYLFGGGPVLPAPFPGCGFDGTADTLDCERYAPCEG